MSKKTGMITHEELRQARRTVVYAYKIDPMRAEFYLDFLTDSKLQFYDTVRRGHVTTPHGAELIRKLAGPHGRAMLKLYEVQHNVNLLSMPWHS